MEDTSPNPASFDDLIRNLKLMVSRAFPGLIGAYVALQLAMLLVQSPGWLLNWGVQAAAEVGMDWVVLAGAAITCCAALLQYVPLLAVGALITGLYRPMRALLVEPESVTSAGRILGMAKTRFWWVLLVNIVFGIAVGLACCAFVIPGLALLFFFAPVTYLVAATDDDVVSAVSRSIKLALANPALMAVWLVAMFVIAVVFFVLAMVLSTVIGIGGMALTGLFPGSGYLGASMINPCCSGVLVAALGIPVWLFTGTVFATMEIADSRAQVAE